MFTLDIIQYGHKDVLDAIAGLKPEDTDKVGVTSHWSVKDTLAHLASYEHLLEDALHSVTQPDSPRPHLDAMGASSTAFNDHYVETYRSMSFDNVVKDYTDTYTRVAEIITSLPAEKLREAGTIPWYGTQYSLEDFIVYASYGHKREHVGQIKQFRKREKERI